MASYWIYGPSLWPARPPLARRVGVMIAGAVVCSISATTVFLDVVHHPSWQTAGHPSSTFAARRHDAAALDPNPGERRIPTYGRTDAPQRRGAELAVLAGGDLLAGGGEAETAGQGAASPALPRRLASLLPDEVAKEGDYATKGNSGAPAAAGKSTGKEFHAGNAGRKVSQAAQAKRSETARARSQKAHRHRARTRAVAVAGYWPNWRTRPDYRAFDRHSLRSSSHQRTRARRSLAYPWADPTNYARQRPLG